MSELKTCHVEYQTGSDNPCRGWWKCSECGCLTDSVAVEGWAGERYENHAPNYCAICGRKVKQ